MNVRKSALVSTILEEFKCEIFERSLYSSDLAPSDYNFFLYVKKFLAGQKLKCVKTQNLSAGLTERLGGELF